MQHRWLGLVVMLSALFLASLVVGCSERRVRSSAGTASEKHDIAVTQGAQSFVHYGCVQCHGLGGKGRAVMLQPSGPSLVSAEFKRAFPKGDSRYDQALVNIIRNGLIVEDNRAASMPAWNGVLSDEAMKDVVAYIRAGLPDIGVPLPPARTGEEIYRAFACVQCHGPLGVEGVVKVGKANPGYQITPSLSGQSLRKKFDSLEQIRKILLNGILVDGGKIGTVYMPAWGKIGTADQIEKVIEYIFNN